MAARKAERSEAGGANELRASEGVPHGEAAEAFDLESVGVSLGADALDYMREALAGRKPAIGPNVAVAGFWSKAPNAQLIGTVRSKSRAPNRFNPDTDNVVLFVEGLALYAADVVNPDTGEVKQKAGEYSGIFGLQLDAGTASLDTDEIVGSSVHVKVLKRAVLPSGLKRYSYDFARVRPPAKR